MSDKNKKPARGRGKILIGILILVVLAGAAGLYWQFYMRGIVRSDDARLDGDLVDIAPRISGTMADLSVNEGDHVKKGQLLFTLEKALLQASLARAEAAEVTVEARLNIARAELDKLVSGPRNSEIEVAEAAVSKAKAALDLASADWSRIGKLYKGHAVSASERDKAHAAWESARAAHAETVKRLNLLREGARDEDITSARANLEMIKAQMAEAKTAAMQARVNLGYTEIRAPFDGIIVRKWQSPGAMLPAGRPVVTLFDPESLYVSANIEEKNIGLIKPGDPVDITVDAFPGRKITGRLEKVLLATNSEFSLIPSEGVSGTFIKVAQRMPVRIVLDPLPELSFAPGLSVEIAIHVEERGRMASLAVSSE